MRILEAFGEPIAYGGEENFVASVLKAMDLHGSKVEMLTPYTCENESIRTSVPVHELKLSFAPGQSRKSVKAPIREFLQREKFDVIHIHSGSTSMLAIYAELAAEAGIGRIIVHAHCAGNPNLKHSLALALNSRAISKYPTHHLACSEAAAKWMFPSGVKSQVVRNGIETARFAYDEALRVKTRAELGISNEKVIGFVGRLCKEKNPAFLLDVAEMTGSALLYVGEGELREELAKQAKSRNIKAIFTGAVTDVEKYYQAMDVFALPSQFEGFSLVTLEAQASGLHCIVSDVVSEDLNVTGLVHYLPVSEASLWAGVVTRETERINRSEELANNGLDIKDVAEQIGRIYFE